MNFKNLKSGFYVLDRHTQNILIGPFKQAGNAHAACKDRSHYVRYCGPDSTDEHEVKQET